MFIHLVALSLIAQDVPVSGPPGMANSGNATRWGQNDSWTHQHAPGPFIGACRVPDEHDDMLFDMLSQPAFEQMDWWEKSGRCESSPFIGPNWRNLPRN